MSACPREISFDGGLTFCDYPPCGDGPAGHKFILREKAKVEIGVTDDEKAGGVSSDPASGNPDDQGNPGDE